MIDAFKQKNLTSCRIALSHMSKIVLITGATAGIGEASAHVFAREKYNLILTGRRADRLTKLSEELKSKYGVEVRQLVFDVTAKDEVVRQLESLPDDWKKVDVLVNNAGLTKGSHRGHTGLYNDWDLMLMT